MCDQREFLVLGENETYLCFKERMKHKYNGTYNGTWREWKLFGS